MMKKKKVSIDIEKEKKNVHYINKSVYICKDNICCLPKS